MMPRQGTMVADRYRLERKVGGGRVSAMWRVQDQVTDGACAVKLLHRSMNDHPEALARFSLEDRLSRELTGAYFPERIGSGSWHSLRYIAWRWYEGECLRSLFERNPKQDVQTVYSIVQETCQALTLVHGAGYTHGDLKPENLFFAENGESAEKNEKEPSRQLKLLGFGVASRLARPLLGSQARRTPGQIVGTPLYLSPDLILGRVPRAGQADLWALSVIVYEALTGRAPFLGTDLEDVLEGILERRAPRPSSVTDNLPGTFDLWWAQALEQQFATPGDFTTSLARALAPALRSSRTQRSASMPDRTAPVAEAFARRPTTKTPVIGAIALGRPSAPTPAGGVTAAGLGRDIARDVTPLVTTVAPRSSADAELRSAAAHAALPGKFAPAEAVAQPAPAPAVEPAARATSGELSSGSIVPGNVASSSVGGVSPGSVSPGSVSPGSVSPSVSSSATSGSVASGSVASGNVAPVQLTSGNPAPGYVSPGNVTSTTVAGIGPAALSVVRALETAAAGATAKIRVVAPHPGGDAVDGAAAEGEAADRFAPLPSPLRDLGLGARKTLVGIIPPSSPTASPAPLASSAAPSSPGAGAGGSMVIAGTPCKSIEMSDVDERSPSMAGLRRPGSPTVPFPRPRAALRRDAGQGGADTLQEPGPEHHGTLPTGSWQQRTHNTLRIVLTDPDHRPHLVAGLVVCAAAALVIFVSGRSPVAGTGVLGQSTSSLSAEPGAAKHAPALDAPKPVPAPAPQPRQAGEGGADLVEPIDGSESELAQSSRTTDSPLPGKELAPGLVVPPSAAGAPSATPGRPPEKPRFTSPSPLPPTRPEAQQPVPPAAVDGTGNAPHRDPALATPPRAVPKKPTDPVPPSPRPANADFDFGI